MSSSNPTISNPVEYGEAPLPSLKTCLTPDILETLWMARSEEEMRDMLLNDVFNFGDWFFRGDNRADIYTDFYHLVIKFLLDYHLVALISFPFPHISPAFVKQQAFLPLLLVLSFIFCRKRRPSLVVCDSLLYVSPLHISPSVNQYTLDQSLSLFRSLIVVPYTFPLVLPPPPPEVEKTPRPPTAQSVSSATAEQETGATATVKRATKPTDTLTKLQSPTPKGKKGKKGFVSSAFV
jgi:hypothetical protein